MTKDSLLHYLSKCESLSAKISSEESPMELLVTEHGYARLALTKAAEIAASSLRRGTIYLEGEVTNAVLHAKDYATINAEDLRAETVHAEASISGRISLYAQQQLTAKASDMANILYIGSPVLEVLEEHGGVVEVRGRE